MHVDLGRTLGKVGETPLHERIELHRAVRFRAQRDCAQGVQRARLAPYLMDVVYRLFQAMRQILQRCGRKPLLEDDELPARDPAERPGLFHNRPDPVSDGPEQPAAKGGAIRGCDSGVFRDVEEQHRVALIAIAVVLRILECRDDRAAHVHGTGDRVDEQRGTQTPLAGGGSLGIDEVSHEADDLAVDVVDGHLVRDDAVHDAFDNALAGCVLDVLAVLDDIELVLPERHLVDMPAHVLIRLAEHLSLRAHAPVVEKRLAHRDETALGILPEHAQAGLAHSACPDVMKRRRVLAEDHGLVLWGIPAQNLFGKSGAVVDDTHDLRAIRPAQCEQAVRLPLERPRVGVVGPKRLADHAARRARQPLCNGVGIGEREVRLPVIGVDHLRGVPLHELCQPVLELLLVRGERPIARDDLEAVGVKVEHADERAEQRELAHARVDALAVVEHVVVVMFSSITWNTRVSSLRAMNRDSSLTRFGSSACTVTTCSPSARSAFAAAERSTFDRSDPFWFAFASEDSNETDPMLSSSSKYGWFTNSGLIVPCASMENSAFGRSETTSTFPTVFQSLRQLRRSIVSAWESSHSAALSRLSGLEK